MTLEEHKTAFVDKVREDVRRMHLHMTLLQGILLSIIIILVIGSAYGLFASIGIVREAGQADVLQKTTGALVGGGSTLLGFLVIHLFRLLKGICRERLLDDKRFVKFESRASRAHSLGVLDQVINDYGDPSSWNVAAQS